MHQSDKRDSATGERPRSLWLDRIAPAVAADSIAKVTGYGTTAAIAALGSVLSWMLELSHWLFAVSALVAVTLTVPVLVGFGRSRQRKKLEHAQRQNKKLTKLVKSCKRQIKELLTQNQELERRVRKVQRREEARAKADQILADLLRVLIGNDEVPTPGWAKDALQFERWLNSFTKDVVRAILQRPDEVVGLAIVRERDSHYELVHRTSDIPPEILALEPAPVLDELEPCAQRHAPHACALPGPTIDGDPHWVAVFPQQPIDKQFTRASLRAATELIMAAYVRHRQVAGT